MSIESVFSRIREIQDQVSALFPEGKKEEGVARPAGSKTPFGQALERATFEQQVADFPRPGALSGIALQQPWTGPGPVTSPFGMRDGVPHRGVDIGLPLGTTVEAAAGGRVVSIGDDPQGYGRYLIVEHSDRLRTLYAHLQQTTVREGDEVRTGQALGASGNSGRSTGPHLHFEVHLEGKPINPELVLFKGNTLER